MTPEQLAEIQRAFFIKTEKNSAVLISREFEAVKAELFAFLIKNERKIAIADISLIAALVDKLSTSLETFAPVFSRFVGLAQKRVISFASETLKSYFKFNKVEISSSIFETDKEAIEKLIGRTQTGESLRKFFLKMKPDIAARTKTALIEGFTNGDGAREIARRISDVSDVGFTKSLSVSRTETISAYRRASIDFYDSAGIKEYRFLSVLDSRVCPICWSLHGRKFKLKTKPNIHVNCRCSIVPVIKGEKEIETGIEKFNKLQAGYQKQILGAKRFELFEKGEIGLSDFVLAAQSKEYGQIYKIKNLADFRA